MIRAANLTQVTDYYKSNTVTCVKLAALIMVSSSLKIDTEIRFYICNIGTLYPKVNSA